MSVLSSLFDSSINCLISMSNILTVQTLFISHKNLLNILTCDLSNKLFFIGTNNSYTLIDEIVSYFIDLNKNTICIVFYWIFKWWFKCIKVLGWQFKVVLLLKFKYCKFWIIIKQKNICQYLNIL